MNIIETVTRLHLAPREKAGLAAAVVAVALFLLLQAVVFPLLEARRKAGRRLAVQTSLIREMHRLQREYRAVLDRSRAAEQRLSARKKGFTLFGYLEELAGQSGMKSRIAFMKPTVQPLSDSAHPAALIEMKLEALTLEDLVTFLYQVETRDPLVVVKRLAISKSEGIEGRIQAVLQVETIEA